MSLFFMSQESFSIISMQTTVHLHKTRSRQAPKCLFKKNKFYVFRLILSLQFHSHISLSTKVIGISCVM